MTGEVVYLYAFDVANEITMTRIQEVLSRKPVPFTIHVDHTLPRDVPLYQPLAIEPPPLTGTFGGQAVRLLVRIYQVGVVSITVRVSFETQVLNDLLPFHKRVLDDGRKLDHVIQELCRQVCQNLQEFLVRASPTPEPEPYTVFCLKEIADIRDVPAWLASEARSVAGLLTETDPDRLSEAQVAEELRLQRSFEKTEAVVIDWDAALVVDLDGYVDDVLYVLELANLQYEEFRSLDQTLDRYLNQAYDDLQRRRGLFGVSNAALKKLRWLRIDVTKLADEVTHITKFIGDWYLARVFIVARDRFHLDQWRASVGQRLAELDRLYSAVHSEINERRMLWLEVIIVAFFAIDLLAIFFFKH